MTGPVRLAISVWSNASWWAQSAAVSVWVGIIRKQGSPLLAFGKERGFTLGESSFVPKKNSRRVSDLYISMDCEEQMYKRSGLYGSSVLLLSERKGHRAASAPHTFPIPGGRRRKSKDPHRNSGSHNGGGPGAIFHFDCMTACRLCYQSREHQTPVTLHQLVLDRCSTQSHLLAPPPVSSAAKISITTACEAQQGSQWPIIATRPVAATLLRLHQRPDLLVSHVLPVRTVSHVLFRTSRVEQLCKTFM